MANFQLPKSRTPGNAEPQLGVTSLFRWTPLFCLLSPLFLLAQDPALPEFAPEELLLKTEEEIRQAGFDPYTLEPLAPAAPGNAEPQLGDLPRLAALRETGLSLGVRIATGVATRPASPAERLAILGDLGNQLPAADQRALAAFIRRPDVPPVFTASKWRVVVNDTLVALERQEQPQGGHLELLGYLIGQHSDPVVREYAVQRLFGFWKRMADPAGKRRALEILSAAAGQIETTSSGAALLVLARVIDLEEADASQPDILSALKKLAGEASARILKRAPDDVAVPTSNFPPALALVGQLEISPLAEQVSALAADPDLPLPVRLAATGALSTIGQPTDVALLDNLRADDRTPSLLKTATGTAAERIRQRAETPKNSH